MPLLRTTSEGTARRVDGSQTTLREKFSARTLVGFAKSHPCLGARAASATDGLFVSVLERMDGVESAFTFLQDIEDYYKESDGLDPTQKSLGVVFFTEANDTQDDFADRYWSFVQLLHDIDAQRFQWDPTVSSDINSQDFELSLAGRAVFTTTLNPRNPRVARMFPYPVWIINQLSQFNHLRAIGRFTGWQKSIRNSDAQLDPSGEPNPILVDHGEGSAVVQLAGSKPANCGFQPRLSDADRQQALSSVLEQAKQETCPKDVVQALQGLAQQT